MKSINNKQEYFEKIIVDFDKYLYTAAKSLEVTTVIVTNNKTGESHEFENVSTHWGLGKEVKGWCGVYARLFGVKTTKADWTVEPKVELRDDIVNHIDEGLKQIAYSVGAIKNLGLADNYLLCIGGENNFRYDVATTVPYKGERPDKPLMYQELREAFIAQYKRRVHIAENMEADDSLAIFATESQKEYLKTGKYKYLLAYVDKDINQVWGPHITPDKKEEGIQWIERFDAAKFFAEQMLKGDKGTDNIIGLKDCGDATREKYNLGKRKGCGEKSAQTILRGADTITELFQRVVDAYKDYHGECWKEYINENFRLLWMLRRPEIGVNIFEELLDKIGVRYE